MVHRCAVDWLFTQLAPETVRTNAESEVRGLSELLRSRANAAIAAHRTRLSLCGRAAHGRSDASVDASVRGNVRRNPAESGWRTGADCRAVEIRLQEHQVHRENKVSRKRATDHVESNRFE